MSLKIVNYQNGDSLTLHVEADKGEFRDAIREGMREALADGITVKGGSGVDPAVIASLPRACAHCGTKIVGREELMAHVKTCPSNPVVAENANLRADNEHLTSRAMELITERDKFREEAAKLRETANHVLRELGEARADLSNAEAQRDALAARAVDLAQGRDNLTARIGELTRERNEALVEAKDLREERNANRDTIEALRWDLSNLTEANRALEAERDSLRADVKQWRYSYNALERQRDATWVQVLKGK